MRDVFGEYRGGHLLLALPLTGLLRTHSRFLDSGRYLFGVRMSAVEVIQSAVEGLDRLSVSIHFLQRDPFVAQSYTGHMAKIRLK